MVAAGCGGAGSTGLVTPPEKDTIPVKIILTVPSTILGVGPRCPSPSMVVGASVYNKDGAVLSTPVVWSSTDATIIVVDNGIVKGIAPGNSTLLASAGTSAEASKIITVAQTDECRDLVSSVVLSGIPDTLYKRATVQASVQIQPATALQTNVWSTEDSAVLSVDQTGNITAVGVGTTRVCNTASKIQDCKKVAVILLPFTVSLKEPLRIYLPGSKCTPTSYTITASLPVKFLSLSPETLKVDTTGVVTPLDIGVIPVNVTEKLDNRSKLVYFLIDPCT